MPATTGVGSKNDTAGLVCWFTDTSLDQLLETADDVVANPVIEGARGQRRWSIRAEPGMCGRPAPRSPTPCA